MKLSSIVPSLVVFACGAILAYAVIRLSAGQLTAVFERVAGASMWAVPLTLAVSVAMFNNMLRVYDRLEKFILECSEPATGSSEVAEALEETDTITSGLLGNAFIAIASALSFFLLSALREIPEPAWYPRWLVWWNPSWVAVSVEFGLATMVIVILLVQFSTIPPLVALYRFFAVDRYLGTPDVRGSLPANTPDTNDVSESSHIGPRP